MNKFPHIILITACICCFASLSGNAQTLRIVDRTTKIPIPNVTIEEVWIVKETGKKNSFIGETNEKGEYLVSEEFIKNRGTLTASHHNYQQATMSAFNIIDNQYLLLLSASFIQMNEVVVSASRFEEPLKDVPRQIEIIRQKEIAFANQQTTADLLQNSGQVFVQKSQMGGGSPIMRGFEANKTLIVIDGVRMNNAIYRGGHLQNVLRIDQNMLEKTELFFGPGSVVYGSDALGGVMHFTTLQPLVSNTDSLLLKQHFFTRYGTVNNEITSHYDLNLGFKKWAFLTSISASSFGDLKQGNNRNDAMGSLGLRDSSQQRINGKDVAVVNNDPDVQLPTAYKQIDLLQKIVFTPNKNISHLLNLQYSTTTNVPRYDRLTEKTNGTFSSAEWYYGPETRTLAAYQLHLKKKTLLFDEAKLITAYQYIEESRHNRNFGAQNKTHRNEYVHVLTTNIDLAKRIKRNEIRYGIEVSNNKVISNANRENIVTGAISAQSTRYPDGGSSMNSAAVYIAHSWEISDKLILTDGLRFNLVQLEAHFTNKAFYSFLPDQFTQQNSALNGQLGLVYLPGHDWKFSTAFSTGFRAPNIDDVGKIFDSQSGKLAIIPNSTLKPENSYNIETSIRKLFYKKIKAEATAYYTLVTDLITNQRAQVNGSDSILFNGTNTLIIQAQNTQQAYLYGCSFTLSADVNKYISLVNTFNYTYGRIKTDSTDYPLDHIPPIFGRSAINLSLKNMRTEFFVLYNGWKHIEDYNLLGEDNQQYATAKGMPSWYTLNIRIAYSYAFKQAHSMQIKLGCENILDRNYRNFASGISAPGRNIYTAIGFTF